MNPARRLDLRDALADVVMRISDEYGVQADPAAVMDAAHRIACEDVPRGEIEAMQDVLIGLSRIGQESRFDGR